MIANVPLLPLTVADVTTVEGLVKGAKKEQD